MRRYILSKMLKTYALMNCNQLSIHVPKTMYMNKENVSDMLHLYRMVYVKPDIGTFGQGVMKVEMKSAYPKVSYRYQLGTKKRHFDSFEAMYHALTLETRNKTYLVQKGIHLNKYKGNAYDIRVMVQKNPQKIWETTGMIGRVAHPQKIVTNFHNGGELMSVQKLLQHDVPAEQRKGYLMKLNKLGRATASALASRYPGIREIGIDLGIDHRLKAWILEVNTSPDPYIFKYFRDRSIFSKIIRYRNLNRR
jgi:glutathione synthase/RimK-type ligase-like ATP-grasp enzyme